MRLMAPTLYRAIPELDPFTDDQCQQFMLVANRSWRWSLVRHVVIGMCTIGIVGGAIVLAAISAGWGIRNGFGRWAEAGAFGIGATGVSIGCLGALRMRDLLLLRRVRWLLRERGRCFACNYSLLGVRVAESGAVVCPECGSSIVTDPAFNELIRDESGGASVYRPVVPRESPEAVARRRKRRRWFLKWSAISIGGVLLLMGGVFAGWSWFLESQATRARSARNASAFVRKLVMENQSAPAGAKNEWTEFKGLCLSVNERMYDARASGSMLERTPVPDFSLIAYDGSPEAYDASVQNPKGMYEKERLLTLAVMASLEADGTLQRVERLSELGLLARDLELPDGEPMIGVLLPELGGARSIARLCKARMRIALWTGDDAGYIAALEQGLSVARALDKQAFLIDRMVSNAIDAMLVQSVRNDGVWVQSPQWREGVLRVLLERTGRPSLARTLATEEQGTLDTIRWLFSDASRVRRIVLTGGRNDPDFGDLGWLRPFDTLASCERATQQEYAKMRAYAETPAWQRGGVPAAGKDVPQVVGVLMPSIGRAVSSEESRRAEVQSAILNVAVARYFDLHGKLPDSIEAIGTLAPKELLIDAWTGKVMAFAIVADDASPTGKTVALGVDADIERERLKREGATGKNARK